MAIPAAALSETRKPRHRITADIVCLLLVTATTISCGGRQLSRSVNSTSPSVGVNSPTTESIPQPPPTLFASPSGAPPRVVLTNAAQSQPIAVPVGTVVEVDLTGWDRDTISAPHTYETGVLQPISSSGHPATTTQATFRAVAVGDAVVFAVLTTHCKACMPQGVDISIVVVAAAFSS